MTTHTDLPPSPAVSRRRFLRRAGVGLGSVAVLGTGAVAYRADDQGVFATGEGPAYQPWDDWDRGRGLLPLVGAATLAPSPHNSQPWLFGVHDDRIDLFADPGRGTGAVDPFGREMHIGLGAALENLVLQAGAAGRAAHVELLPPGAGADHVVRVSLGRATGPASPLARQIPRRHTDRSAYAVDRVIGPRAYADLTALADDPDLGVLWVSDRRGRAELGELLVAATEAIVADADQSESDHAWFRQSWDEVQNRRDGITVDTAGLSDLTRALAKLLPAQSRSATGDAWVRSTRNQHTRTAAGYGIIVARDAGDVRQQLAGGRLLERIHLWTTGHGLALHPMNQLTERADREVQLGTSPRFGDAVADLVPSEWEALTLFRLGHPTGRPRRSPRRPILDVLLP